MPLSLKLEEIEKKLDKTFKRSCLADDDDETYLSREVFALEEAIREILNYLKKEAINGKRNTNRK